jgi:hypothetical protein
MTSHASSCCSCFHLFVVITNYVFVEVYSQVPLLNCAVNYVVGYVASNLIRNSRQIFHVSQCDLSLSFAGKFLQKIHEHNVNMCN